MRCVRVYSMCGRRDRCVCGGRVCAVSYVMCTFVVCVHGAYSARYLLCVWYLQCCDVWCVGVGARACGLINWGTSHGHACSIREQGLGGRYFMKAPCERYFSGPSACALEKLLAQDLHIPLFKLPEQRTTLSLKWAVICSLQGTGDRWWNRSCYSTCVQRRQHSQREGRRKPLKQGSWTEYVPTSLVVKHGTRGISDGMTGLCSLVNGSCCYWVITVQSEGCPPASCPNPVHVGVRAIHLSYLRQIHPIKTIRAACDCSRVTFPLNVESPNQLLCLSFAIRISNTCTRMPDSRVSIPPNISWYAAPSLPMALLCHHGLCLWPTRYWTTFFSGDVLLDF